MLTDLIARAWEQERAKYEFGYALDGDVCLGRPPNFIVITGTQEACQAHLDRLCAAAVERAIADAGMVVVPAEPTEAMIEAGHGAVVFDESYSNSEYQQSPDTCWRAMIAAWGAESV